MSQVKYTGHGANTGGLQGHSIGADYPYMVVGVETPEGLKWQALNMNTGTTGAKRDKYKFAWYDLNLLRLEADILKQMDTPAFSTGVMAYLFCSKRGNPYELGTREYQLFGSGHYNACRYESLRESSLQNYTNAYA